MRQKSVKLKEPAKKVVKDIRRATRKRHSSEEKILLTPELFAASRCNIRPPWWRNPLSSDRNKTVASPATKGVGLLPIHAPR
jgi:hypothetical protein